MKKVRSHSRGLATRLGGTVLAVFLAASPWSSAKADTQSSLDHAKARLSMLESQMSAARAQLDKDQARVHAVQAGLNELAVHITTVQDRYAQLESAVMAIREQVAANRERYNALRDRLDERARQAYEHGPAGDLMFILSASSIADLSDRVQFVGQLNQNDVELSADVQDKANVLDAKKHSLDRLLGRQSGALRALAAKQAVLDAKFAAQKNIYDQQAQLVAQLTKDASEVNRLVGRLQNQVAQDQLAAARAAARAAAQASGFKINGPGPFRTCPVQGPHAYSDSFGAPRYAGGYHPHAGNDILAPRGTPIVAPFDGVATRDPNGLGGNAVIVKGAEGYVYNAHLDSYGASGRVTAGTVIGYVGDTGDARGGPTHDHFEWHPNVIPAHPYRSAYGYTVIGTAVDPFPYLNLVC
jgi:murein DD-endopeptidase MepM/ murein hydrolase activator NlpD